MSQNFLREQFLINQVNDYMLSNELHPALQSAYLGYHSTETALFKVTTLSMNNRLFSVLGLLDLSAAFDTIDHTILLALLYHN